MKEGWEYKKFKDISYSISDGDWIEKKDQSNSGIRLIQTGNIGVGKFIPKDDSRKFITEDTFKRLRCSEIFEGDVLISRLPNPLGRSCILPKLDTRCITAVDCSIVRIKKEIILPEYFIFYTQSQGYFTKIDSESSGTTRARITRKKLEETEIPVPPLSEQQSIVDYLDSAFAKIDAMKANAEKALNEAKALFQASLKEMLEPKEGWEEKKLGNICRDVKYGTSTPSNENGEYKYLRMNNITNDGFLDVSHYKKISLPEKELEKCVIKKGDILFNRTNSRELVGKSCVFTEEEDMVIAGYLIRIRLKEGFEPQFITYNMNMQRSLGLFQHLIVGAVHQANISANNIQKILINYPPLSEQQIITEKLNVLKFKVDRLQENFDKISQECDALKQAILRQVFE